MAGLSVRLHVVAQGGLHAVVLAHVVDAVTQERVRGHHRVAGPEAGGGDDLLTLGLELLLLVCGAVGMYVRTGVRLTAAEENHYSQPIAS